MPNVSVIDSKLAPVSTCLAVRGGGAQAAAAPVYTLHGLSDRSRHPTAARAHTMVPPIYLNIFMPREACKYACPDSILLSPEASSESPAAVLHNQLKTTIKKC